MSDDKSTFLSKITPSTIVTMCVLIGGGFVTYYKVDELVKGQETIKTNQTEMHDDSDIMKVRVVQEIYEVRIEALEKSHELENKINEVEIKRLESVIEFYKNK
jgi:hypothetical protein